MPILQRLTVYPLKSLDGLDLSAATFVVGGGLAHDREYCMVDADGKVVNGKRTARVVTLRATWDFETGDGGLRVSLRHQDDPPEAARRFHLEADRKNLESWLSDYFAMPIRLKRNPAGGFPDDTDAPGPTVISAATLAEVARWFSDPATGIAPDTRQVHRRFRPNLVVGDATGDIGATSTCPPFWEDGLVPARVGDAVEFAVGAARLLGVNPCRRCVVPSRDPDTGVALDRFQRILADQRRAHLPAWAPPGRFEMSYRLALNTMVDASQVGQTVRVGDDVRVL